MATERLDGLKINFDTASTEELFGIREHQINRVAGAIGDLAMIDTYLSDRGIVSPPFLEVVNELEQ